MINRRVAKRQISAARALLALIRTHGIECSTAAACDQMIDATERLSIATDALARSTYGQALEVCDALAE